ncbi:MAG TPA: hypothetical protein VFQ07_17410 [Candidatus Polarisedimenticolia bacterium]|nr:hypothetical protein [Candidatus Polarisedimenticolia bacterium]
MPARLSSALVVVLLAALTPALAFEDPHGGTGAFTTAMPGIVVTDRCEDSACVYHTSGVAMDLAGRVPSVVARSVADCPIEGGTPRPRKAYDIRFTSPDGTVQPLGTFTEYCFADTFYYSKFDNVSVALDPFNGVLYVEMTISNYSFTTQVSNRLTQVAITGLPTLFDIMLTYQPGQSLSWTTPQRPLGLTSADRFEVYTGALGHTPLFQDAQPIACSLPASGAPAFGEVIAIPDPLPDPPIGEGRYVVVAAERAGEVRYGRQRMGGVTSGRNPADFPACQ